MTVSSRTFSLVRVGGMMAVSVALFAAMSLLSGCSKGDSDAAASPAPAASAAPGQGMPAETAQQKADEDASRARVAAERAAHAPPAAK